MRHSYEQDFCLRHEKTGPQKNRGPRNKSRPGQRWKMADVFLPKFLQSRYIRPKSLIINSLEARGVEPLSSTLSAQTYTCLSDVKVSAPRHAPPQYQLPIVT